MRKPTGHHRRNDTTDISRYQTWNLPGIRWSRRRSMGVRGIHGSAGFIVIARSRRTFGAAYARPVYRGNGRINGHGYRRFARRRQASDGSNSASGPAVLLDLIRRFESNRLEYRCLGCFCGV